MGYKEYDDLYKRCNIYNTGKYFMMVADLKNSRSLSIQKYKEARKGMLKVQSYFVKEKGYTAQIDPNMSCTLILGDAVGVMIQVTSNFNAEAAKLEFKTLLEKNVSQPVHFASGYCETVLYEEGCIKYYSGYLFKKLMELHK